MAKNEDGYEKYLEYIEDNLDEVTEKVTGIFDERKKVYFSVLAFLFPYQNS